MSAPERIELHVGPLRFSALAQGEGPLVLCLHGFPDNNGSFRHQLPALAAAGYRAVAPMMRGYEPSSQPREPSYFLADLVDDVSAWADELGADQLRIVGHDWGALVAYAAAARMPERITSMVTMAVPHIRRFLPAMPRILPSQLRRSWYVLLFQLRRTGDFVFLQDRGVIEKLWRDWSPGFRPEPEAFASIKQTFAQPGVRKAAISYYRALFSTPSARAAESWRLYSAKTPVPTLAMTGARDGCVDTRLHDVGDWREDYLGPAEMTRLEWAGHFLHQEQPEAANEAILGWFERH